MNTFRPTLSGLTPSFHSEAPRPAPLTQETIDVATTHTNAERILVALRDAGGSLPGADLRAALADIDQPERAKAVGLLRNQGRIRSEGSTLQITYHLVEQPQANGLAAAPPRAARQMQPAAPVTETEDAAPASLSLELQFLACLEQIADDPEFAVLPESAKIRAAEWLVSRLRDAA
ncbi:hypothetical protein MMG85_12010 [Pseudoxanthomonas sp. LH2527]|uniref:hypothetical protein n=1 Tax=Pseudoxanthomonas sp. LH2527 TaxID=2923249 RepID=UPI001F12ED2A|nr:hypothetical protein [Pseudoxanthomonas sp. LH2527]MCH6484283.1 hypothetical protein [Pseudoxanthomonas sp. LH2527]